MYINSYKEPYNYTFKLISHRRQYLRQWRSIREQLLSYYPIIYGNYIIYAKWDNELLTDIKVTRNLVADIKTMIPGATENKTIILHVNINNQDYEFHVYKCNWFEQTQY